MAVFLIQKFKHVLRKNKIECESLRLTFISYFLEVNGPTGINSRSLPRY